MGQFHRLSADFISQLSYRKKIAIIIGKRSFLFAKTPGIQCFWFLESPGKQHWDVCANSENFMYTFICSRNLHMLVGDLLC